MIATEIKTNKMTVRIHDTFCNSPSQGCMSRVNQIVSDSYKRRTMVEESSATEIERPVPQN